MQIPPACQAQQVLSLGPRRQPTDLPPRHTTTSQHVWQTVMTQTWCYSATSMVLQGTTLTQNPPIQYSNTLRPTKSIQHNSLYNISNS